MSLQLPTMGLVYLDGVGTSMVTLGINAKSNDGISEGGIIV